MAERPVFIPTKEGSIYVERGYVSFDWFSGFSISQKRLSIRSLHEKARGKYGLEKILEISTKSDQQVGRRASAFNLNLKFPGKEYCNSVEAFYQGSKVFEHGGPFVDLYQKNSLDSKKDQRLQSSGDLKGFIFQNEEWELDEHFYDWLYLNALIQNKEIAEKIIEYDAFTDIEFNPKKSFNCQAYAAALFKAATIRGMDLSEIESPSRFKELFPRERLINCQQGLF